MNSIKKIFVLILLAFLPACTGTKKYYKAAEKLEKQGLINEAAEFYMESLRRKPTNVDAQIKLKQVGQKYVTSLSTDFFRYFNMNNDEKALSTFEKMKNFTQQAQQLNVNLDYPHAYDEDYRQLVERYCDRKYHEGEKYFKLKQYGMAIKKFDEVKKYKPEYKKMNFYYKEAYCEPIYDRAMQWIQEKRYAEAIPELQKITAKYPDYKRASFALDVALNSTKKTITMINGTSGKERGLSTQLAHEIRNSLSNNNNIEFVSNPLFENAKVSADNKDVLRAFSKAAETDYLYVFYLSNYKMESSPLRRNRQKAWLQITQTKDDSIFYSYVPVEYFQASAQKKLTITYNEELIRASDMATLNELQKNYEEIDQIEYNELPPHISKKNIPNLFPVNPQLTPVQMFTVRNWRKQFDARNTLRSDAEMEKSIISKMINQSSGNMFSNLK
ncbi:MAG: hypothetical protein N3F09_03920 [Bacteroidia bacterium]|nr:hypothetical protein [Bacteroidia bacterium]